MTLELIGQLDPSTAASILTFNRGIEREALRVTESGSLSLSPHPAAFGSKLTHPKITTDFSEAQLELITPVHQSAADALDDLEQIHRYLYTQLGDEILWSASMPCVLQDNDSIPLAYYGDSSVGRLKTTYRSGLGYRYGRGMQTICAVHYNFSFPDSFWQWLKQAVGSAESDQDFMTRRYFDLMRNFRRWSWLLTYLFGASPAVCNSFVKEREHSLTPFDEGTAYLPFATSLRSGNLGYQSDAQAEHMRICYNSLETYVKTLTNAICQEYAPYADFGTQPDGNYRQINSCILQSEAEFYSSIRAKRVPGPGENFLARLLADGVQYIEVRLLDVNPYLPLGIDESDIDFLDTFLLYCLFSESPDHDELRCGEVRVNTMKTVHEGRSPDLELSDYGTERKLTEWGGSLLNDMQGVAAQLDRSSGTERYSASLKIQKQRLKDAGSTPSGQVLADMTQAEIPFFRFAMNQALRHRKYFESRPLSARETEMFEDLARQSVADQEAIERDDSGDFDAYLADFLAAYQNLR